MKKVFLSLLVLLFLFSFYSFSITAKAQSPESIDDVTAIAPPYEKPAWYLVPFYTVKNFLEEWRKDNKEKFQNLADNYKKIIDEKQKAREEIIKQNAKTDLENFKEKSYIDSSKGNPLNIPIDAIVYYFYNSLAYIFTTIWLFYSTLGLVVFLILRFIWVRVL